MIFQSSIPQHTYTVLAGVIDRDNYGRKLREEKGLRAKFRGNQRLFDSRMAQDEQGWSDEERLQVEAYLIGHVDFNAVPVAGGVGAQPHIYLADGQEIPPEHAEVYEKAMRRLAALGQAPNPTQAADAGLPEPPKRCMAFEANEGELRQCPTLAELGQDLCELHLSSVAASAS